MSAAVEFVMAALVKEVVDLDEQSRQCTKAAAFDK
jgi:hypothetical protein